MFGGNCFCWFGPCDSIRLKGWIFFSHAMGGFGCRCVFVFPQQDPMVGFLRVPGCEKGEGGNWGTLRIREDWGTLGNIRED